jgi:nitroreductase
MAVNERTGFDLDEVDRLLTTTKQVRQRLDLSRPVPTAELLECIELAGHAPMGGKYFAAVGRPYLEFNREHRDDDRSQRVLDSALFLVEHLAEVPALVLSMRLDRPPLEASQGQLAAYYGSVVPGVWSFQLAARARGIGSAWTTFHLEHEAAVAELLGIPETVTQVCLLAVGYYTGDTFTPAPRRSAADVTYRNTWKQPAI